MITLDGTDITGGTIDGVDLTEITIDGVVAWVAWVSESGRLYHCDTNTDNNYELNIDTLAVINTASSPNTTAYGIGGIKT